MVKLEEIKQIFKPKLLPIIWNKTKLTLLDQSRLPFEKIYVDVTKVEEVSDAIRTMKVRGAPAIGITAGYGMVLAIQDSISLEKAIHDLTKAKKILDESRPTAVNLMWATSRMLNKAKDLVEQGNARSVKELKELLEIEANKIFEEEYEAELKIGLYGIEKVNDGDTILTQCNAGGLATGTGLGTALAPAKLANALGIKVSVIAPETRPWLQGSRLTVYELMEENIPVTLIADTAVGLVMFKKMVNSVMVGADRILSDGHVFNKIGTFKEAVIAHELGIPFYALAPSSTFDMISTADQVKIEERSPDEVRSIKGVYISPKEVKVYNPVFDVTPPKYVSAIITEYGIIYPPFDKNIRRMLGK
ncbi:translation initiation factor IF-2B subunit alpha [Sulfolobus acidocaldarius SUSAZ]|nr:translation initiation factor IF-2B subunit alpha [Sulfolobus acidocaldarius SUSAZ]